MALTTFGALAVSATMKGDEPMFSTYERLNLINQFRILARLSPGEGWEIFEKILENGFEREYYQLTEFLAEPLSREEADFVQDTLVMYDALQTRHSRDKDKVPDDVAFPGFDGNNESRYLCYLRFLHEDEGKWNYLKLAGDLNSHWPAAGMYRRMLEVWRGFGSPQAHLTEDQANAILAARVHPENR